MKAVGIKTLKSELSRYLQLVRRGEVVLVLDRDEVVAELRQPSVLGPHGGDRYEAALAVLEAEGVVRRALGPGPSPSDVVAALTQVPDVEEILREVGGDRF